MTEWSGPWNVAHGDGQLDEERTRRTLAMLLPDGVAGSSGSSTAGLVTPLTTGTRTSRVNIFTGACNGIAYRTDAGVDVVHPVNASGTLDRVDLVVLRASATAGTVRLAVRTGSLSGSPIAPDPLQDWDAGGIYEVPMGEVLVRKGVTTFSAADAAAAVDRRQWQHYLIGSAYNEGQVGPTASTAYVDGGNSAIGSVWVPPSGRLLVTVSARATNSTANGSALAAFRLSGRNVRASTDVEAAFGNGTDYPVVTRTSLLTGLSPGLTTVTTQYRAGSGTATFERSSLLLVPDMGRPAL